MVSNVVNFGRSENTALEKDKILNSKNNILKENQPSNEERQSVDKVISFLRAVNATSDSVEEVHPSEEVAPTNVKDLENNFYDLSKEAKDNQKHLKSFHSFLVDVSKIHGIFSKELGKYSQQALSHVQADTYLDRWWSALSITLDHFSQDQEYLSSAMCHELAHNISRIDQEHSHIEKQLNTEGMKYIQKLKESQMQYDLKFKEVEKIRRDMGLIGAESSSAVAVSAGSAPNNSLSNASGTPSVANTSNTGNNKLQIKLQLNETQLNEVSSKHSIIQQEINEKLPRILSDYKLMKSNLKTTMIEILLKLTDLFNDIQSKYMRSISRLKIDLAASVISANKFHTRSNASASDYAGTSSTSKLTQSADDFTHSIMLNILEMIAKGDNNNIQIDMKSESAAEFAASLFTNYPHINIQWKDTIGKETCVWFNAFCGRMYRDAVRSEWFHNFFCRKSAQMLNKGKRPDFIDEYSVSNVEFGSVPPLLTNIQWIPITNSNNNADVEYDIVCEADMSFRSGLKFTVNTRYCLAL
jgi:hypothetical protein